MNALEPHINCEFVSPSCDPASFWFYLSMIFVLITAAGLMAGLTMGLLSLDKLNIRILEMEGTVEQKRDASSLLPILNKHHLLLVTLLLVNAAANEALPIFLSKLVPESVSIVLSVTCVLLFGEILPSAIFTGPNQVRIAASLTPVVRFLMVVTFPIAYPISKCLDYFLGADHEEMRYKRQELKALVALQRETKAMRQTYLETHEYKDSEHHPNYQEALKHTPSYQLLCRHGSNASDSKGSPRVDSSQGTRLHLDEVTIIHGALDLSAKCIREAMIPMKKVFMLEYETKLDSNVMADILASGYSRIPIYRKYPSNIVGLLLVKRLIVVDPEDERSIGDLALRKPIVASPNESCYHILNEFQMGRSHIALVTKDAKLVMQCWQEGVDIPPSVEFVGIITIEDVIEEIIGEEIEDESDVYVHDIVNYWRKMPICRRKVRSGEPGKTPFIRKRLKVLADRARNRVQCRKLLMSGKRTLPSPSRMKKDVGTSIEIKIMNETTPLLHS